MVPSKQFLYSGMSLLLALSLAASGCAEADVAVDEDAQSTNNVPSNNQPDTGRVDVPTPAPVASIEATPSTGIAPLQVAFSAQVSSGSGAYDYAWDFGDSQTSDAKSPSHLYETPGTFEATLVVTDRATSKISNTAKASIRVGDFDSPLVSASASPSRGAAPLSVSFTTTTTGGSTPYSYVWNFGDGTPASSAQAPSHEYTTPGTYTATVTVTDANGKTDSDQVEVEVETTAIFRVELTANHTSGLAPLSVTFASQIQGGESPYTYAWDFGDGATSTTSLPSHTFNTPGSYNVELTLTDANGAVATNTVSIEVQAPDALIVNPSASPDHGIAPLTVQFQGDASGGSGTLEYQWNFGDGQTSTEKNPRHIYVSAGSYTASLVVTDALGTTANGSVNIEAGSDLVPSASASASPQNGVAPLTVELFGNATGGDAPLSYKWTFGDGTPSVTTRNANHTYANPGSYTATFLVTDADGDTNSATVTINVRDNLTPSISANATPTSGHAPLDVAFSALAVSGDAPYSYQWTFGDGSGTSSRQNPSHQYTSAGSYTATVTVTDADGDTASDTVQISVSSNSVPAVSATVDRDTGVAPHTVQFSATGSGGDGTLSYEWIFGDSTPNASGAVVSHTYTTTGNYEAEVIVTDADGDTASATVPVLVTAGSPDLAVESFTATPNGRSLTYTIDIKNRGAVDSTAPFYITFYHDRASAPDFDSAIDGVGIVDGGDPTISAGETIRVTITFDDLPADTQDAYVWIDYLEDVADLDRSNNISGPVNYTIDAVMINEFMYDSPQTDEKTFIELRGTPGKDMTGYKLVSINGNGGAEIATFTFPQGTTIPADGFLVIGDGLGTNEDIVDPFADLQNGPDNLVLRDPSDVEIDAVGYGFFNGSEVFVGQGQPTYEAKEGYSLGRDGWKSTGDNRTDFVTWRIPTPGAPNELPLTNNADTCADAFLFSEGHRHGIFSIKGNLADGASNSFTSLAQTGAGVCEATGDTFGGRDQIYQFTVPSGKTGTVKVSFEDHSMQDLDLILTGAPCNSLDTGFEACVETAETSGVTEATYTLSSGDYYLVVLEDSVTPSNSTSLSYSIRVEMNF